MNRTKRTFNPLIAETFRFQQSENAKLLYTGNWGPAIQGTTISSDTWTLEDGNATLTANTAGTATTSCLITSGQAGENRIVNKVTLANGEIDERTLLIKVKDNDDYTIYDDYSGSRFR